MKKLALLIFALTCWASSPQAQDTRFMMLCPIDGAGTDANPYRSRVYGMPGYFSIDIRPDGGATATGRMICGSNSLPANMTGVFQIASSFNGSISAAQKNGIRTALGLTDVNELTGTTFDQILPQLLIDLPKAKAGLWKPLQAGRDGKYKIFMGGPTPAVQTTAWYYDKYHESDGGLRADIFNGSIAVAAFIEDLLLRPLTAYATTLATETFTASDGNLAGCEARGCTHTWSEPSGSVWTVATNRAEAAGVATGYARLDSAVSTSNMEASVVAVNVATNGGGTAASCAIAVRKDNTATLTMYRHSVVKRNSGELNSTELGKIVAGAITLLASSTTDVAANDVVLVSADADSIVGKLNGVAVTSVTDTAITTGTFAAFRYSGDDTVTICQFDSVNVQDITAAATGRNRGVPLF